MGLQEGVQDKTDFQGVLASILGRFLKAWERQKMRLSCGRADFSEDSGRWKIRCYFGAVLGMSWGGFREGSGACVVDFRAFKRSLIFDPMLKPEKVVSKS